LLLGVSLSLRLSHGLGLLLACHIFTLSIGYLATFAVGISAMCATVCRAIGRFRAPQSSAFRRTGARICIAATALNFVGIVLGMFWSKDHRGHWWQWDPREVGAVCVLGWNCVLLSLLRPRSSDASALLAGIVANIIVAVSWFGPALLDPPRSSLLPAWYRSVLLGFVMLQCLLIYAALLPAGCLFSTGAPE
jgi:ABC-type transport system involved in cytochrome c biogenesis permease subunit